MTEQELITKLKLVHGEKYNYDKIGFIDRKTKINVICPKHGSWKVSIDNHLRKRGCPKCHDDETSKRCRSNTEDFLVKLKLIHGEKYNYSKVKYTTSKDKVCIICTTHGDFYTTPNNLLQGKGCPKCRIAKFVDSIKISFDEFVERSNKIHNNRYQYDLNSFTLVKNTCKIICPVHGEYEQTPDAHMAGKGCSKCCLRISKPQIEVEEFFKSLGINYKINTRKIIPPLELDIITDSFAVEFNGIYWHSFKNKIDENKNKHLEKFQKCQEKGIKLFQFFEDEWKFKTDICKSILRINSGKSLYRINARDTEFCIISTGEAKQFLDKTHLQGSTNLIKFSFGLKYDNELVMVITFCNHSKDKLSLTRMASKLDTIIVGGAAKIFKNALKNLPNKPIVTFSNNLYSIGEIYNILGFKFEDDIKPSYEWVIQNKRMNKRNFRHKKLEKFLNNYDPCKSEADNMFAAGYRRIWDAGYKRWLYENNP
jgi:hypothetical protein